MSKSKGKCVMEIKYRGVYKRQGTIDSHIKLDDHDQDLASKFLLITGISISPSGSTIT